MRFLIIFFLIVFAAFLPVLIIFFTSFDFSLLDISIESQKSENKDIKALDKDSERYYELKNKSCETLKKDFYIATNDYSHSLIEVSANEKQVANLISSFYNFNETTRTYVKGDQMKIGGSKNTTVWKQGRKYYCEKNCIMKIMDQSESNEYYSKLHEMRTSCQFFGKTELPKGFLIIKKAGPKTINGNRCESFFIYLNKSASLNSKQQDLIWAFSRSVGPVEECLDESTGILVFRNITLNLTNDYLFDYENFGYFLVNQETTLVAFRKDVPDEFLSIPQN